MQGFSAVSAHCLWLCHNASQTPSPTLRIAKGFQIRRGRHLRTIPRFNGRAQSWLPFYVLSAFSPSYIHRNDEKLDDFIPYRWSRPHTPKYPTNGSVRGLQAEIDAMSGRRTIAKVLEALSRDPVVVV